MHKFYTAGPESVASWIIKKGATAQEAAGRIHTDFQKNFIWAEISKVEDWEANGGTEKGVRNANKWVKYGKDYIMKEGDVVVFKHGGK